jgi:hypothetical protein
MSQQNTPSDQTLSRIQMFVLDQATGQWIPFTYNSEGGGITVTFPPAVITDLAALPTIATNTGTIATQTTNIATSTATIATQVTGIHTDTTSIASSTASVATNTGNIATNTGTVATNIATQNSYDSVYAIAGAFGGNGAYATILTASTNYKRAVITLTEQTGTARTYRLRHTSGAVVIYRAFDLALAANKGHVWSGFAIKSGDVIECQSSSASSVYCSIEGA